METIKIGTLINAGGQNRPASTLRQILPHGFESFSISFWKTLGDTDLHALASEIGEAMEGSDALISSIGVYGNPLGEAAIDRQTRDDWQRLIDAAPLFGCDLVTGFTGRVLDCPLPDSIARWVEVFGPLAEDAAQKGVRLAFENCHMGGNWKRGDWNIAHGPDAWQLMFEALPAPNIGLQWEPCHQMVSLIDPMPQLRKWAPKIFHVHGKDAQIHWDIIREHGIHGPKPYVFHRHPGFGDSNWTQIISDLRAAGFQGSIDIEGWHDPVYRGELEMTGQVHALNHLKSCRGSFVPNPG